MGNQHVTNPGRSGFVRASSGRVFCELCGGDITGLHKGTKKCLCCQAALRPIPKKPKQKSVNTQRCLTCGGSMKHKKRNALVCSPECANRRIVQRAQARKV